VRRDDRPLRRRYGRRSEYQRFLIYCEGELTEVSYFKGVRRELHAATVSIQIGRAHGEPYRLVDEAIEHQRRAPTREQDRYEAYDQVWCVFDVEAPRPHPRLIDALALARRHGVHCAVSNPCFELWLMLHFKEQAGYLTTDEACRRLEACGCGYRRQAKQLDYQLLRDRRRVAHGRAEQLHERYRGEQSIISRNPWTSLHVLVDALFRNAGTDRAAG
jgi:hypothetical protein